MFRFMQLGISALLMALLASWVVAAPYDSTYVPRPTADFVIRNAVVYDGTGAEPKVSDVVVKGGRISAMGVDLNLEGLQIIDATGHWLTRELSMCIPISRRIPVAQHRIDLGW